MVSAKQVELRRCLRHAAAQCMQHELVAGRLGEGLELEHTLDERDLRVEAFIIDRNGSDHDGLGPGPEQAPLQAGKPLGLAVGRGLRGGLRDRGSDQRTKLAEIALDAHCHREAKESDHGRHPSKPSMKSLDAAGGLSESGDECEEQKIGQMPERILHQAVNQQHRKPRQDGQAGPGSRSGAVTHSPGDEAVQHDRKTDETGFGSKVGHEVVGMFERQSRPRVSVGVPLEAAYPGAEQWMIEEDPEGVLQRSDPQGEAVCETRVLGARPVAA